MMVYTKYFTVCGITIRVDSELPIRPATFASKFDLFEADGPGLDTVHIVHRFDLPCLDGDLGRQIYKKSPWVIYQKDSQWVYVLETSPDLNHKGIRQISVVNEEDSKIEIFNGELGRSAWESGSLEVLTLSPSDQILLARILANRSGCYLHANGVSMDGKGYLFAGHSGTGKSTISMLLKDECEILCDDRMILRKWEQGFFIHGHWAHGKLPLFSNQSAPLSGIFFLEKAKENRLIPVEKRMDIVLNLLGILVRPLASRDWWKKMLVLVEDLAYTVPCYRLRFDKTGEIFDQLKAL